MAHADCGNLDTDQPKGALQLASVISPSRPSNSMVNIGAGMRTAVHVGAGMRTAVKTGAGLGPIAKTGAGMQVLVQRG